MQQIATRRHMALMNESGHVTWSWDEENDEQMIPTIDRLMREGYVFWIVQRDPLREAELEDTEDLRTNRHVIVKNEDFAELMAAGVLRLSNRDTAPLQQERRAADARDAVANDTVAHRRIQGG
jgi:hypothetical protein